MERGEQPAVAERLEHGVRDAAMAAPEVEGGWAFPVFVGHRRRLAPDDVLFETSNEERGELAKQAVLAVARGAQGQLDKESQLSSYDLATYLSHKYECAACHASLPTAHLLSCHISELHDSFFAAQASRRMRVYCCLVEGCSRKFCTVEERKQHLVDHHRFPRNYGFDRIHLRRRKGQIRPLPQFRKGHGRKGMESEGGEGAAREAAAAAAAATPADPAGAGAVVGNSAAAAAAAAAEPAGAGDAGAEAGDALAGGHEQVVAGMGRLSMAARDAPLPQAVSFGRRNAGRGMVRGRGQPGQGPLAGAAAQKPPAAAEVAGD